MPKDTSPPGLHLLMDEKIEEKMKNMDNLLD